jgi:hypothetical protein
MSGGKSIASRDIRDSERLAHPLQRTTLQLGKGLRAGVLARDELTARVRLETALAVLPSLDLATAACQF